MKKILHKLTYAQNPSQYEAYNPSYYEEILCKVLTVKALLAGKAAIVNWYESELSLGGRGGGVFALGIRKTTKIRHVFAYFSVE